MKNTCIKCRKELEKGVYCKPCKRKLWENEQDRFCILCFKSFKDNSHLNRHNKLVHEKPKIEWTKCEACNLELPITPNDRLMNTHLRVYHS